MSSIKQLCKKIWRGNAEFSATKEFDSVESAAETNSPGNDAKIKLLGLTWGNSSIKLIKEANVRPKKSPDAESENREKDSNEK